MFAELSPPWSAFLRDLDVLLPEAVELHCIGGFALVAGYSLTRATNDLDYRTLVPFHLLNGLQELAGAGSELHKKHRVYLQKCGVDSMPESYDERLTEIPTRGLRNLKLMLPDPYDLALSKLGRNIDRDREDVQYLATTLKLSAATLRERYQTELRSIMIGRTAYHDQTLEFWIEAYFT
jgi:Nucleotidyltransferase of unknown function (DUF6036)